VSEAAVTGFDWDAGNREKCQKHGVSLAVIEAMFQNAPLVTPDPRHSKAETRYLAIGAAAGARRDFLAFTFRHSAHGLLIRPISARYMHQREIDRVEQDLAHPRKRP
jgi:hypothetical protein